MGFILLRTKNAAAMKEFLDATEGLVLETEDDQVEKHLQVQCNDPPTAARPRVMIRTMHSTQQLFVQAWRVCFGNGRTASACSCG